MDSTALNPLLEQLDSSLEDLQEAIQQYVGDSAACQAKSLTPIERAKLYATIPYAIESLLFCVPHSLITPSRLREPRADNHPQHTYSSMASKHEITLYSRSSHEQSPTSQRLRKPRPEKPRRQPPH